MEEVIRGRERDAQVLLATDWLPYRKVWFREIVTLGLKEVWVYCYTLGGLRDAFRRGIRVMKFHVTTATGQKQDSHVLELDGSIDVMGGPVAVESEWGTLDFYGYPDNIRMPTVHMGRLLLK